MAPTDYDESSFDRLSVETFETVSMMSLDSSVRENDNNTCNDEGVELRAEYNEGFEFAYLRCTPRQPVGQLCCQRLPTDNWSELLFIHNSSAWIHHHYQIIIFSWIILIDKSRGPRPIIGPSFFLFTTHRHNNHHLWRAKSLQPKYPSTMKNNHLLFC